MYVNKITKLQNQNYLAITKKTRQRKGK